MIIWFIKLVKDSSLVEEVRTSVSHLDVDFPSRLLTNLLAAICCTNE